MIVYRDLGDIPDELGRTVVAIGKFDGVHVGHRAILDRARVEAAAIGAEVIAVTFDRNPLAYLRPDVCPADLVSLDQKLALLAGEGVDGALVLRFDESLAESSAASFVDAVLVGALNACHVLVGSDFRFGRGGEGTPDTLREAGTTRGFTVDTVDDVGARADGRRVSSTWIRELLAEGRVADASRLLGRAHSVRGTVVQGDQRGRELGYPTANLGAPIEGFVPADGVYAGWLVDVGDAGVTDASHPRTRYPAAISVGTNPTFGDVAERRVEAYVLDETDLDLYGHRIEVHFTARVRDMIAFDGVDPLIAQMQDDVTAVRALLG